MKISFREVEIDKELLRDLRAYLGSPADSRVLSWRSDRLLLQYGNAVAKVHAPYMGAGEIFERLQILMRRGMEAICLMPLQPEPFILPNGRCGSLWPLAKAVNPELDDIPWDAAGRLLAELHKQPLSGLPPSGARRKVMEALHALRSLDAREPRVTAILRAAETLNFSETKSLALIHGDWHLGQLVFSRGSWRLIDVDDMGIDDPRWDLARPAAFYAAGLIRPEDWTLFLHSYRDAAGPALPDNADVWKDLDGPARALTVQCAATAVLRSERQQSLLSEAEEALIESCQRIGRIACK